MKTWDEDTCKSWITALIAVLPPKIINDTQRIFEENAIDGEFLWNMTKDDYKELKFAPKVTITIRTEIDAVKGTSHLSKNLKFSAELDMHPNSLIFSLQEYDRWLSWNAVPFSKWKEYLLENLSAKRRNSEIVNFITEKLNQNDNWPDARLRIIQNSHKNFNEMNYFSLLSKVHESKEFGRSIKEYHQEFNRVYLAVKPLLVNQSTFTLISEFKKGLKNEENC
jgi:hypothetical protein